MNVKNTKAMFKEDVIVRLVREEITVKDFGSFSNTSERNNLSNKSGHNKRRKCRRKHRKTSMKVIGERIVPQCSRKACQKFLTTVNRRSDLCTEKHRSLTQRTGIKQNKKDYTCKNHYTAERSKDYSHTKEFRGSKRILFSPISSPSWTNEYNGSITYDDVSLDSFFTDHELDTLIKRTKERERVSTRETTNQWLLPLCESTPKNSDINFDEATVFSCEMDVSINSMTTVILDPEERIYILDNSEASSDSKDNLDNKKVNQTDVKKTKFKINTIQDHNDIAIKKEVIYSPIQSPSPLNLFDTPSEILPSWSHSIKSDCYSLIDSVKLEKDISPTKDMNLMKKFEHLEDTKYSRNNINKKSYGQDTRIKKEKIDSHIRVQFPKPTSLLDTNGDNNNSYLSTSYTLKNNCYSLIELDTYKEQIYKEEVIYSPIHSPTTFSESSRYLVSGILENERHTYSNCIPVESYCSKNCMHKLCRNHKIYHDTAYLRSQVSLVDDANSKNDINIRGLFNSPILSPISPIKYSCNTLSKNGK